MAMKTTEFIPPEDKSMRMTMDPSSSNNMNLLLLQLTCMIAVFLITLAGALLPLKVIKTNKSISLSRRRRSERILSFSNCLAGGVFLATCFLGLLPSAREKFQEIFEARNVTVKYPFCEATVIMGFFLILTFEQLALSMQQYWQGGRREKSIQMNNLDASLKSAKEDGKLKFDADHDDDEEEEDLDLFNRDSDKQPMLSSSKHHSNTNGGRFRVKGHYPDETGDAENGHHSHEAHSDGHSHLGNPNNTGLLRSLILFFALSTHSVFEGMALGLQEDIKSIVYLLIAMLAHESLAAFALGASLIKNSVNTYLFIIYGVFFSGMIPCGIAIGLWIRASPGFGAIVCSAIMQALAAGIFIFVTFFEILNHELEVHRDRPQKIAFAFLGYVILAGLEAVG